MEKKEYNYRTVKLPNELIERLDRILDLKLGYTSRADFVKEAVRRLIAEIESGTSKRERAVYDALTRIERMLSSIRKRT